MKYFFIVTVVVIFALVYWYSTRPEPTLYEDLQEATGDLNKPGVPGRSNGSNYHTDRPIP